MRAYSRAGKYLSELDFMTAGESLFKLECHPDPPVTTPQVPNVHIRNTTYPRPWHRHLRAHCCVGSFVLPASLRPSQLLYGPQSLPDTSVQPAPAATHLDVSVSFGNPHRHALPPKIHRPIQRQHVFCDMAVWDDQGIQRLGGHRS